MRPVNLYYTPDGQTALRYWRRDGSIVERVVRFPAQLVMQAPDAEAEVTPRVLETPSAALFAAFRAIPLCPQGEWRLAEGEAFGPVFRAAFEAFLEMMRKPVEERWCVRGEPGYFLQFGMREGEGYTMGALVLPCGKPAVLTFRAEDLIQALPPARAFETMSITSQAEGLSKETSPSMGWDTRIRLPITTPGGALLKLHI